MSPRERLAHSIREIFGIEWAELTAGGRSDSYVTLARHVAIYLYIQCGYSHRQTARAFQLGHHKTVTDALETVAKIPSKSVLAREITYMVATFEKNSHLDDDDLLAAS